MTSPPLITTLAIPVSIVILTTGIFIPVVARLTRPDLFFSITVPPSLRDSPFGRQVLRRFSISLWLVSVIGLALTLTAMFAGLNALLAGAMLGLGALVEVAGSLFAYISARREVWPHHVEPSKQREAVLDPRPTRPMGGWLGQIGPFLIVAAAAVVIALKWDSIPARFPIHWDLAGRPNGWALKSAGSVFFGPVIGAIVCLFLCVLFNGFARGVRRIRSAGAEAEKESRFLRIMLSGVLTLEYAMAAMFAILGVVPLIVSPVHSSIWVLIATSLTLIAGAAIVIAAVRCGQGGWRLKRAKESSQDEQAPVGDRTPDECWKAGLIYYNPADPAVWVEKRFGIGWTVNFGQPRAWIVMGGILLFAVVIPVLAIVMVKH